MSDKKKQKDEQLRRWRLMLGGESDGTGCKLSGDDSRMDETLEGVYGDKATSGGQSGRQRSGKEGGLGGSAPKVARWLGDIREFFPRSVVRVMQQDAIERLNLRQLLLEPEVMEMMEPDVHLVADLIALGRMMPSESKETARMIVKNVVEEIKRKLENPMREAITGSLNRALRNNRPRHHEIDWNRTIRVNLKHYQPQYKTIIPERRIGYGHKRSQLRDIILCVDQSGSMGTSVVYSGIFGAVMASLPSVKTQMVVFDTSVVDLTEDLKDPVDLLFGVQLWWEGRNINRALGYCQQIVRRPEDTILVLITDLYEGGNQSEMLQKAAALVESGVQVVVLLALNDDGAPSYHSGMAKELAKLGIVSFACTPDLFPDLMAAAINKKDLSSWAARHDIVTAAGDS